MESDLTIESEGIDTGALQAEISRRVKERRETGLYSHELESALAEPLADDEDKGKLSPIAELDYAATRARLSWEVTDLYPVQTEKKHLRTLVIYIKIALRHMGRLTVGPMQARQTAFNRHVAAALEAVRKQALIEHAERSAEEKDLSALADAMTDEKETGDLATAVREGTGDVTRLTVLGTCPGRFLEALLRRDCQIVQVAMGSHWDEIQNLAAAKYEGKPISFVSQLDEGSQEALVWCDLAFWLRPEALIKLARKSYLALARGGSVAVAVHQYAQGAPAPAWCAPAVVEKALSMAGFKNISVVSQTTRGKNHKGSRAGFVAIGQKR